MKNMGFKVQGSDQNKSKNIMNCIKAGIKVFIGHSKQKCKKFDNIENPQQLNMITLK